MAFTAQTLAEYLTATLENLLDHRDSPPQLMELVQEMDKFFHDEICTQEDDDPISGLLFMNSYALLMSSVSQALAGHLVAVFPVARSALESACYGFLVSQEEEMGGIWLNRHDSKNARDLCRRSFSVADAVRKIKNISVEMAEFIQGLYDASIDYGAHPNVISVLGHLTREVTEDDEKIYYNYSLTGVYGPNSWQVNQGLLVCVEMGQAIAFLIAASIEEHPLLSERLEKYQQWMDSKNRLVEQISGKPLNYSGPMYAAVRAP